MEKLLPNPMTLKLDILLIEDNAMDTEFVIEQLKPNCHEGSIFWFKTGGEGLDFLFAIGQKKENVSQDIKLIILDLKLPGMNGLEFLRILKLYERTSSIPVVILTGSADEKDVNEAYKLGVNSYMQKPTSEKDFLKVISEISQYWLNRNSENIKSSTV